MLATIREHGLYASAARTATPTAIAQTNDNCRGGHFIILVSAIVDTPSVVPKIQGYRIVEDDWYDILVGTAITASGLIVLKVYPGITPVAGGAASDILPARWRLQMVHGDADSITYSAASVLVP